MHLLRSKTSATCRCLGSAFLAMTSSRSRRLALSRVGAARRLALQRQVPPLLGERLQAGALAAASLPQGKSDLEGLADGQLHRLALLLRDGQRSGDDEQPAAVLPLAAGGYRALLRRRDGAPPPGGGGLGPLLAAG